MDKGLCNSFNNPTTSAALEVNFILQKCKFKIFLNVLINRTDIGQLITRP